MFFEAIFTICMTDPATEVTTCRIMVTEMTQLASSNTQCVQKAEMLSKSVGAAARKQFPQLKFSGEAVYCGSTATYTESITKLVKSGYEMSGFNYVQERF